MQQVHQLTTANSSSAQDPILVKKYNQKKKVVFSPICEHEEYSSHSSETEHYKNCKKDNGKVMLKTFKRVHSDLKVFNGRKGIHFESYGLLKSVLKQIKIIR